MLRFFSRLERSRNLVLLAFSLLLLLGLVVFYIPNTPLDPTGRFASSSEDETVIAKVGSKEIKLREFKNQLAQIGSAFGRGNSLPMTTLKQLGMDKQALDQLIGNRITLDQAESLNLMGTDREIADIIKGQFVDETGKFIGVDEYKRRLRLQGLDVGQFEADRRNEIGFRKLRDFVVSSEIVSDREVEEKYKSENTKVEAAYATIDLEKVRAGFKPTDEELKAFYESHKQEFKANEPTRKVEYLFISTDDVAKIVPVTEEQLRKEYETRKQFELRASIIKLNVLTPEDETTVKTKIDELNQRARGGKDVPAVDFATLAKGNSQDPTASKGGDIGWVKKDANKSGQWQQRVYTNELKSGQIDGPFRDGQSWYILKATEQREVPFAQMRETLKATLSNNEAFKKASTLADTAYEKATEFKDLRKAAEVIAKELKVSPDSLIKTTPYFKAGDPLPDLGKGAGRASNPAFEEAVSTLKKGEIGDKVSIPGGQAVPVLADVIENGKELTYDQARNQVEDKLRREKEPTLGLSRAQEILNQAQNTADFQRLAKAAGLEVKTDTNFNNYTFPGASGNGMQVSEQARTALIKLKEGEVFKTPIKVGTAYLMFAAIKRTEPDLSKLAVQRNEVRQSILNERQTVTFDTFIKSARKNYDSQGKIKIYQDRIDKFFATAATPQQ
ncbi:MAG: SurA N-terminal domain-containing protein [Acidobacteria bacterium]|nr:SurA N-terminal domain-containing protein [Acidobacteriota bacterium]